MGQTTGALIPLLEMTTQVGVASVIAYYLVELLGKEFTIAPLWTRVLAFAISLVIGALSAVLLAAIKGSDIYLVLDEKMAGFVVFAVTQLLHGIAQLPKTPAVRGSE